MESVHALTIRLSDSEYAAARRLATRRGVSINRLVRQAILEIARKRTASRLQRAYNILASGEEENNVEGMLAVQAEALLDG